MSRDLVDLINLSSIHLVKASAPVTKNRVSSIVLYTWMHTCYWVGMLTVVKRHSIRAIYNKENGYFTYKIATLLHVESPPTYHWMEPISRIQVLLSN